VRLLKRLIVIGLDDVCCLFHWRWYTCRWFAVWSFKLARRWDISDTA
jgi:hypothetical protein